MRPEEIFALDSLKTHFGGDYIEGEDPPDAYFFPEEKRIAVEVTRLAESVTNPNENPKSRTADTAAGENVYRTISDNFDEKIPNGKFVFLTIPVPIKNIRKTIKSISDKLNLMISNELDRGEIDISGNYENISISFYPNPNNSLSRVQAAFPHENASSDITTIAAEILRERIATKNAKINPNTNCDEYWLALLNEYWIADADSYRYAMSGRNPSHTFDKILLISLNGSVDLLFPN